MSFASVAFAIFYSIVLVAYWLLDHRVRLQNALILIASLFFYGWWDWRFLGLVIFTAGIDYASARLMEDRPAWRGKILLLSLGTNLAVLFYFKYLNFFADSFSTLLNSFGLHASPFTLNVILPLGISFYTFQSMAYTIDVYRGVVRAERDPLTYFAFITFFPQLVAGPIERASHMLPQFRRERFVTPAMVDESLWLIVWGFFLKIAVADNLAPYVDVAFRADQQYGWSVILGTIAFGFQIFGDFCGYSLIAKGTAGLMGFELMWNFRQPYLAASIQDFWRRWHVSLSNWLRDYLYIPLGGNRRGSSRTYLNLLLTMILGGLWHGAAWNFLFWGIFHGVALAGYRFYDLLVPSSHRLPPAFAWLLTIVVVFIGWFLFRTTSWDMIVGMIAAFRDMSWTPGHTSALLTLVTLVTPVFVVEWLLWRRDILLPQISYPLRPALSAALIAITFGLSGLTRSEFIYFQF